MRLRLGTGGDPQTCVDTTNGSGVARCQLTPTDRPSTRRLSAQFAGSKTLKPSGEIVDFTITRQETDVAVTGPDQVANGTQARLSGVLHEENERGAPIADRQLTLALGRGESRQSCTATTNPSGVARCTIPSVDQPLNDSATVPVSAQFSGDAFYENTRASKKALLEYHTGRAYGVAGTVDLPLVSVSVPAIQDTGKVRTARATRTSTPCMADVSAGILAVQGICPEVTTTLAPGTSKAMATVEEVRIGLPGVGLIKLNGVRARSTSTCASGGSASASTNLTMHGVR